MTFVSKFNFYRKRETYWKKTFKIFYEHSVWWNPPSYWLKLNCYIELSKNVWFFSRIIYGCQMCRDMYACAKFDWICTVTVLSLPSWVVFTLWDPETHDSKYGLMLFMLHFISRRKQHRHNDKRLRNNLVVGFRGKNSQN